MLYLDHIKFPDSDREFDFFLGIKRTCHDSYYPFRVLSGRALSRLDFEPITILYGSNGCGKTTALNVIAEKLSLSRETLYNKSNFFQQYVDLCWVETFHPVPENSRIITSDDVFDYMLNVRALNEGIDRKREGLYDEFLEKRHARFQFKSLDDYEELKRINKARSVTQSKYVRHNLMDNVRELSNGESAFKYFTEAIGENGLYLLDEPENSLSPGRQQELMRFLEDSVRFFGCQFIISTHSPFLLSMRGARIYDMDRIPVETSSWTDLPNVRAYYDFFKTNERAFD